jgi:hypothetical protein
MSRQRSQRFYVDSGTYLVYRGNGAPTNHVIYGEFFKPASGLEPETA